MYSSSAFLQNESIKLIVDHLVFLWFCRPTSALHICILLADGLIAQRLKNRFLLDRLPVLAECLGREIWAVVILCIFSNLQVAHSKLVWSLNSAMEQPDLWTWATKAGNGHPWTVETKFDPLNSFEGGLLFSLLFSKNNNNKCSGTPKKFEHLYIK